VGGDALTVETASASFAHSLQSLREAHGALAELFG
jgi:hypothetical protein